MDIIDNRIEIWPNPVSGYAGDNESERLGLIVLTNVRVDSGRFEAANPSLSWSIKTAVPSGLTGTVLAQVNGVVVTNPAQWNRSTVTFTGAGTDTMDWLMVFYDTLTAEQIAYLNKHKK